MHVFLYEWATGGGFVDESGSPPTSLLREATAMVSALARDLAATGRYRVSVLRDLRILDLPLQGCDVIEVQSGEHVREEFQRLAGLADATLLIAPEFDKILERAALEVVLAGGRLASPDPKFVRLAADKNATAERLGRAGVRVPEARIVEQDQSLPPDFSYPAVLKPVDGAGSQDVQIVAGPYDTPYPYAWPRRLERFCPGLPASLAALCGPAGKHLLVPCRQRLSGDGRLRYLGGELPLADGLAERARQIVEQALQALPPTTGYVGVDLVLGAAPDGSEDFVIEVNPRLTTSYVALRAITRPNLAEAMLACALGEAVALEFQEHSLEFDVDGNVGYR